MAVLGFAVLGAILCLGAGVVAALNPKAWPALVAALGVAEGLAEALGRADQALYAAKHAGRNRVQVLQPALHDK